jgi:hypothetical protein
MINFTKQKEKELHNGRTNEKKGDLSPRGAKLQECIKYIKVIIVCKKNQIANNTHKVCNFNEYVATLTLGLRPR